MQYALSPIMVSYIYYKKNETIPLWYIKAHYISVL